MNKTVIALAVVAAFLAAVAAYYYFFPDSGEQIQVTPLEREEEQGLGGELYERTGNPALKVPETNPFEKANTNPLQGASNPFEGGYRNPFE